MDFEDDMIVQTEMKREVCKFAGPQINSISINRLNTSLKIKKGRKKEGRKGKGTVLRNKFSERFARYLWRKV